MPYRTVRDGDVFVRARVLLACSDVFKVHITDLQRHGVTVSVPAVECAHAADIGRLRRRVNRLLTSR